MKRAEHKYKNLIALSAGAAAALLWPHMADAIGPRNQYVSNATNAAATTSSPIGDTVWVSSIGGSGGYGSGTVIGAQSINGTDVIDVLTADHVVTGESWGRVKFGTNPNLNAGDPGGPAALAATTFIWNSYQNYSPPGANYDIAILRATASLPANVWNPIFNNIATITQPGSNPFLNTTNAPFAQIGYGAYGSYMPAKIDPDPGGNPSYFQGAGTSTGTSRYQNNTQTGLLATAASPYLAGKYTEPLVTFNAQAPGAGGTGGGMQGDSGGPLFTGGASYATKNLSYIAATGAYNGGNGPNPTTITINYSNSLSAVFVGGTFTTYDDNPQFYLRVGATEWAVPIDQGLFNWLAPWTGNAGLPVGPGGILTAPEPGPFALLAVGGIPFLLRRKRKA